MTYHLDYVFPHNREKLKALLDNCRPDRHTLTAEWVNNAIIVVPPPNGILSGGVLRNDLSFVQSTGVYQEAGGIPDVPLPDDMTLIEGTHIYIGWFHNGWGHSFTDYIKKFWYLQTIEGQRLIANGAKLLYICSGNIKPNENIIKMMKLCGVDIEQHSMIMQHTRVDNLIVPDDSLSGGIAGEKRYTLEYVQQILTLKRRIQTMLLNREETFLDYDKIYLSRGNVHWNPRRDYCEKCVEKAFRKMGYQIIYPEKMSVEAQLHMLTHCNVFAATEGSVSHNAVFCPKGTKVIIVKKSDYVNRYQLILDQIADVDVTYIDAHRTPSLWEGSEWYGPFFMHISRELERFAGKRLWVCYRPYWTYYLWWYKVYGNRRLFKRLEAWLEVIGIHINPYHKKSK